MKKIAVLLVAVLCAAPVFAGDGGIIKLSLWGKAAVAVPNNIDHVTGIDIGIGSTTEHVDGVQWNFVWGEAGVVHGVNTAYIVAKSDEVIGLQGALVSINESKVGGIQGGLVNLAHGEVIGLQYGFFNKVGDLHGAQLGFINYAENISKGLHVGLVNIAKNGWFPVMVIVNGRF